jgi:hypothetical protein
MARKTQDVTIDDGESRDNGRTYRITEMAAARAEKWAMRAFLAIAKSGLDVPPDLANGGMRALAFMGLHALTNLSFQDAEPLLDEMMSCVQTVEPSLVRALTSDDIDEVRTRVLLRQKVLELHVGFSLADAVSKPTSAAATLAA